MWEWHSPSQEVGRPSGGCCFHWGERPWRCGRQREQWAWRERPAINTLLLGVLGIVMVEWPLGAAWDQTAGPMRPVGLRRGVLKVEDQSLSGLDGTIMPGEDGVGDSPSSLWPDSSPPTPAPAFLCPVLSSVQPRGQGPF